MNINKFPIIILSSPRTGSTLLTEVISAKYPSLKVFTEPDANNRLDELEEYATSSNQYILKLHLRYLLKFPKNVIKQIINHDAFLIRIRRKNIIDQMVSEYIELCRNVWCYHSDTLEKYKDEIIKIDDELLTLAINTTNSFNNKLDTFPITYDLDTYYEDLIQSLDSNVSTVITPKPVNHTEIYQALEQKLKKW